MTGAPARLCALDLDGTLIDSQHHIVSAMTAAFAAEGIALPPAAEVRRVVGLPLNQAIKQLAPHVAGLQIERLGEAYRDAYFDAKGMGERIEPLFAGALDALDALEAGGWSLGVVTGKGRRGLHAVLEAHGIRGRFVTLKSADDGPGKPDPSLLFDAVDEAGSTPDRTIMLGDTVFDLQMARRARVSALGVSWGYHEVSLLRTEAPAAILDRFEELPAAAERLVPREIKEA
ncbi:MAG: HAD-IA family hydrolase [Alphaproteobacteria bacterium]|nr:HAD-IA family hydrolase [Alphaproteobacteria bacterium]